MKREDTRRNLDRLAREIESLRRAVSLVAAGDRQGADAELRRLQAARLPERKH